MGAFALPAEDTPEKVVGHLRAVLTRLGSASDDGLVFRDSAVEIRLRDKRITVKRLRSGAEVLSVDPDGRIKEVLYQDFERVSDHLMALAQECMAEENDEERANTPMLAEDVEELIDEDGGKKDHKHVDFLPECHSRSYFSVYYCEGTVYVDCSACQRPQAAFQLARRGVGDPPAIKRHRRPLQTDGVH